MNGLEFFRRLNIKCDKSFSKVEQTREKVGLSSLQKYRWIKNPNIKHQEKQLADYNLLLINNMYLFSRKKIPQKNLKLQT